jgi:hypothetical protein
MFFGKASNTLIKFARYARRTANPLRGLSATYFYR